MCEWCGTPATLLEGFGVVERSAQRLVGRIWEGSYSQAAAGAVRDVLFDVQMLAAEVSGLWAGPIVGISWNERPDGFRYLVGVEGLAHRPGLDILDLPAMRFATAWHETGEVLDRYQAMLEWLPRQGLRWDKARMHHREEYPLHADFGAAPVLRLMVPVV